MNEWILFSWLLCLIGFLVGPPEIQKYFIFINIFCGIITLTIFHTKIFYKRMEFMDFIDLACGIISLSLFLYLIF